MKFFYSLSRIFLVSIFSIFCLQSKAQSVLKTERFKVFGVCEQCKERIETTLHEFKVAKANWDIDSNMLTVTYDTTAMSRVQIEKKLVDVGHDTEQYKTTKRKYNLLPDCCRYERSAGLNDPGTKTVATHHDEGEEQMVGVAMQEDNKGSLTPLAGATITCLATGISITSDSLGIFKLPCHIPGKFVISYAGLQADTIEVTKYGVVNLVMKENRSPALKEVIITGKNQNTYVSSLSTFNTLNMGLKELSKATCCNLSESFETSPAVDVSYADAVTGVKQIQLLGLAGSYTQLLTENIPHIRGLAGYYGLTFIPGPRIESIQLTKGIGSVVNGYESIAGQINIELVKPDNPDKLYVNAYANTMSRTEATINYSTKLSNKWSTALLGHANGVSAKIDRNKDGFLDIPTGRQINFSNRYKYTNTNGLFALLSISALQDDRQAGQISFNKPADQFTTNAYGAGIKVQQYEASSKIGYAFPEKKYKSIGLILAATSFNNESFYGLTAYSGKQKSFYGNLIYQSIIGTSNHKFRTGLSFIGEKYEEQYKTNEFNRVENVPGAFFEYTFNTQGFSAIAGLRADHHNAFGLITTPRVHLKYDFTTKTNLRLSAGSGFRVANIFAENASVFVSSRNLVLAPGNGYGYGLAPEKAINYGVNFIHNFVIQQHKGSVAFDLYRTSFNNQTVTDLDTNPQQVAFYNLTGKSFANSAQVEINYTPVTKFDVRLAYRWLDVQTTYGTKQLQKPLVSKHRAFANLAYETSSKWKFDATLQVYGPKRLPATSMNPADKQMPAFSPTFAQVNAQVTKILGSKWEVYAGGENLTGFTQPQMFIDGNNPFSNFFDGSITWGPVNGAIIYTGLRFKL